MSKETINPFTRELTNFGHINYDPIDCTSNIGIPVVKLSNGVRVANFSTSHTLEFVDGTVLPACSLRRAKVLSTDISEIAVHTELGSGILITDIVTTWAMSVEVEAELSRLSQLDGYDVLLIPIATMSAIKEARLPIHRCRCLILDQTGRVLIDKFSI